MARILYCWENGAGTGHLHKARAVASILRDRGHEIQIAVRDLIGLQSMEGLSEFTVHQAPVQIAINRNIPPALNYPEVLFQAGVDDPVVQGALMRAWISLLNAVKPDLVVAEYAPSAALACRASKIPYLTVGTGFTAPPEESPMPTLQPWAKQPPLERMREAEETILSSMSSALRSFNARKLDTLAELFPQKRTLIMSTPETDHYQRTDGNFTGALASTMSAAVPQWPDGNGPKTLIYYHGEYPTFPALVESLVNSGWPTLLIAANVQPSARTKLEKAASIQLITSQIDISKALAQCDVIITHGGHGSTEQALFPGKPLLVVPVFVEQALLGWRLAEQGLALTTSGPIRDLDLNAILPKFAAPRLTESRRAFAEANQNFRPDDARQHLGDWLEMAL